MLVREISPTIVACIQDPCAHGGSLRGGLNRISWLWGDLLEDEESRTVKKILRAPYWVLIREAGDCFESVGGFWGGIGWLVIAGFSDDWEDSEDGIAVWGAWSYQYSDRANTRGRPESRGTEGYRESHDVRRLSSVVPVETGILPRTSFRRTHSPGSRCRRHADTATACVDRAVRIRTRQHGVREGHKLKRFARFSRAPRCAGRSWRDSRQVSDSASAINADSPQGNANNCRDADRLATRQRSH